VVAGHYFLSYPFHPFRLLLPIETGTMTTELFVLSRVPAAHPVHLLLYPKQKSLMERHLQGLYTFLSRLTVHASEVWALPHDETEAVSRLNICLLMWGSVPINLPF